MRAILRFLKLGRKEPFGCFISTLISATLISALVACIIYVVYLLVAVSLVKSVITSSTGFSVSAQYIYVNVFTGYCEINGLNIENPTIYDLNNPQKNIENINNFLYIQSLKLKISPLKLISGKFVISSVDARITFLNCLRLSNSVYNLPEFMAGMKKIVSFETDDKNILLNNFNLFIDKATYKDLSVKLDSISWHTKDFSFRKSDITNLSNLLDDLKTAFNSANAPFVVSGLKVLSTSKF